MNEGVRLNKYLASCAVGSRRKCDELIQDGRVEVNGSPCLNMGTRVSPADHVRVDGKRVRPKEAVVIAFHKPRGYVCTREDELGRETIYALLPESLLPAAGDGAGPSDGLEATHRNEIVG